MIGFMEGRHPVETKDITTDRPLGRALAEVDRQLAKLKAEEQNRFYADVVLPGPYDESFFQQLGNEYLVDTQELSLAYGKCVKDLHTRYLPTNEKNAAIKIGPVMSKAVTDPGERISGAPEINNNIRVSVIVTLVPMERHIFPDDETEF